MDPSTTAMLEAALASGQPTIRTKFRKFSYIVDLVKKTQNNFTNPQSTVYITSGNGGPPSIDSFNNGTIFSTRKQSKEFSYGRVYAYNNSHLKFQQIINSNNTLLDEIIIIKN